MHLADGVGGRRSHRSLVRYAVIPVVIVVGAGLAVAGQALATQVVASTLTTGSSWTAGIPESVNGTVPAGTCSATFTVYGNVWGSGYTGGGSFGYGGEAEGTTTVSSGEKYQIDVRHLHVHR